MCQVQVFNITVPRWRSGYAVACRATITPVQIWTLAYIFEIDSE